MNAEPQVEAANSPASNISRGREWPLLLVLVFFAGLCPTLPDLSRYHGDERYYTDAAITMVQTGDYLTPRYADGAERFNKPLLTYWVLCASYKILGISVLSSRLPFLLAGCGVVWLTWRLGRIAFDADSALVGAVVIAANVQTMTIATRSTPDILLCFFVTTSLCGFAELLLQKRRDWRSYAFAYLGAGLACATKGLWGFLPLLFAFLFWWFKGRTGLPLRELVPKGWLLAGAAIGLSWFVVAALLHGKSSLGIFLEDQTMTSAEPVKWFLLSNLGDYAWATVRHFLPWILFAAAGAWAARESLKGFASANRIAVWFTVGWYALVFSIFCLGFVCRTRYLLPTYPFVAVALGALLEHLAHQLRSELWLRRLVTVTLCIGIGIGLISILGWRLDWHAGAGGVFLVVLAALCLRASRRPTFLIALGLFLIIGFSIAMLAWRPLFGINPAEALAARLSEPKLVGRPVVALGMPPVLSSQLRLVSGGKLNPREVSFLQSDLPANAVLLVGKNWRAQVAAAGYEITAAPFRTKRVPAKDIWKAWRTGRHEDSFDSSRQNFYIAVRP